MTAVTGRLKFTPFWHLTDWGFLPYAFRRNLGCDEFHNRSRWTIIPLVGEFCLFDKGYNTDQPVHLFAFTGSAHGASGEWEGEDVPDCPICAEIKEDR